MFLYTHTERHGNLIIFLAVLQTQALLFHDQLPVGWGGVRWVGVGWDNNVHVPVHTQGEADDDVEEQEDEEDEDEDEDEDDDDDDGDDDDEYE